MTPKNCIKNISEVAKQESMIVVVDVAVVVVAALYSVRKTFLGQKTGWLKSCRERKKKKQGTVFQPSVYFHIVSITLELMPVTFAYSLHF